VTTATAVADGTISSARLDVGRFTVSDVRFAPGALLPWHAHPHGCIATIVDGAVRKTFSGRVVEATRGDVVTMPSEERHEDRFGREGARIVVVELCGMDSLSSFRNWEAMLLSLRVARELAAPDRFTPLVLEGIALELTALAAREVDGRHPPGWLESTREQIRDQFLLAPGVEELAATAGVQSAQLARAFRAHYGGGIGEYARRLRLEWAAERLVRTDVGLACLAAEAGFADQSHFTRAFKRLYGLAPGRYRTTFRLTRP
jgi:AraC family transcriptional regulator